MDTKKVLWTVLCVVIALVVASGMALALAFPRAASPGAPATIAAVAPPRAPAPDEYLRSIEPTPVPAPVPAPLPSVPTPDPATSGVASDVIVVYGDKPAPTALPGAAASATTTSQTVPKPYTPAPATPAPATPTATKPSAAQPSSSAVAKPAAKAPVTVAEYWIQAAAFTSRTRADDLQRELAAKGLSTLITVKDLDGVTWYRVRIGPYTSEREAKGWLEKIRVVAGCAEAYVSKQTVQRSS